jgi:threonine dehydratase
VRKLVLTTPVLRSAELEAVVGGPVWLKCENLQYTGSFKIRGAANFLASLIEADQIPEGVVTYSSGNHGQALAAAAQHYGLAALVVAPETVPALKLARMRERGAEVLLCGTTSSERRKRAEQEAQARGYTIVPPFDHPEIIAGQSTAGLEIVEQRPDFRSILVPVGGGGLLAGVAAAAKALRPDCQIIGVEPEGSAAMRSSLQAGTPVTLERTSSIADGLLPLRPGDLTFAHARALVDEVVTVSDEAIVRATLWLFERARLVVEPSGAAAVAALLSKAVAPLTPVVAILSGGNVALETLASLKYPQQ